SEVEHDRIGLARSRFDKTSRERVGLVDTIALRFQCRTDEAPNLAVVLDDQQLRNGFDRSIPRLQAAHLHVLYTSRRDLYDNYLRTRITCRHCNGETHRSQEQQP